MGQPLQWIDDEIANLKSGGLYNRIRTLSSAQGAYLTVDGRQVLNFCSNNYLGLANHPRLVEAAREAVRRYGVGPAAVRSIAGTTDLHLDLEARLAAFKGAEATITFQSGFTANAGTVSAILNKNDAVVSDELNGIDLSYPADWHPHDRRGFSVEACELRSDSERPGPRLPPGPTRACSVALERFTWVEFEAVRGCASARRLDRSWRADRSLDDHQRFLPRA